MLYVIVSLLFDSKRKLAHKPTHRPHWMAHPTFYTAHSTTPQVPVALSIQLDTSKHISSEPSRSETLESGNPRQPAVSLLRRPCPTSRLHQCRILAAPAARPWLATHSASGLPLPLAASTRRRRPASPPRPWPTTSNLHGPWLHPVDQLELVLIISDLIYSFRSFGSNQIPVCSFTL